MMSLKSQEFLFYKLKLKDENKWKINGIIKIITLHNKVGVLVEIKSLLGINSKLMSSIYSFSINSDQWRLVRRGHALCKIRIWFELRFLQVQELRRGHALCRVRFWFECHFVSKLEIMSKVATKLPLLQFLHLNHENPNISRNPIIKHWKSYITSIKTTNILDYIRLIKFPHT